MSLRSVKGFQIEAVRQLGEWLDPFSSSVAKTNRAKLDNPILFEDWAPFALVAICVLGDFTYQMIL